MHRTEQRRSARDRLPPDALRCLSKALKRQWKRYRKKLKGCQEKFSEKTVHASRVEARRLLSTVELLASFLDAGRGEKVQRVLKDHLDTSDELRDVQVQLLAIGKMRRVFPAARLFDSYLLKSEDRAVRQTRKKIQRLKTSRLRKLVAACRQDVKLYRKEGSSRSASRLLLRAVEQAFVNTARLRAQVDPRRTRTIHRTRIAFKKFRYMVEALAKYLPRVNQPLLAEMRHYQGMMGDVQDAEVLLAAFDRFLQDKKVASPSAESLREELLRRRQWLIRVYLDGASQLREFWP
jgi:CHAD domain-containing protein